METLLAYKYPLLIGFILIFIIIIGAKFKQKIRMNIFKGEVDISPTNFTEDDEATNPQIPEVVDNIGPFVIKRSVTLNGSFINANISELVNRLKLFSIGNAKRIDLDLRNVTEGHEIISSVITLLAEQGIFIDVIIESIGSTSGLKGLIIVRNLMNNKAKNVRITEVRSSSVDTFSID